MATEPEIITVSEVAVQDGNSQNCEIADHDQAKVAIPQTVAITQRGRRTVLNYRNDVREARVVAARPPSMAELIESIWRHPSTLADSGLERFAVRLYALLAIPVVAILYCLVAAHVKPALGVTVDLVLAAIICMWIFS